MILVREKTLNLERHPKRTSAPIGYRSIANAMRYAADWIDNQTRDKDCNICVVTYEKKVKFGFVAIFGGGRENEITFEEIPEAVEEDPG